ncbi:lasso RiPP family leader peptide-containing protein [Wenjunlia tyrosinilytica]|jgi:hypothetical protein|uniref:Lasso RiPP family leader peptide-containing protein n=1 Tax=Wenjunlia tyrosinilytica TaxID=1544741 RepID=A0A917ZK24_9ACTN|nr:lasso RiPP family leader peptide-containing protein [Wenjunlia tyrosinilytica]GGO84281.1 hypothetical protein GCM10012280_15400 [Wenjunlia tyrosinilytica]
MVLSRNSEASSAGSSGSPASVTTAADGIEEPEYERPVVVDLGHVREVTLGSSSSGSADANSQYYW